MWLESRDQAACGKDEAEETKSIWLGEPYRSCEEVCSLCKEQWKVIQGIKQEAEKILVLCKGVSVIDLPQCGDQDRGEKMGTESQWRDYCNHSDGGGLDQVAVKWQTSGQRGHVQQVISESW